MSPQTELSRHDARAAEEHPATAPDLEALLRARMADFSRAEKRLATYFLHNSKVLHFETGASIARAVGVSEMTVGRFVRGLGFGSFKQLKQRLRPQGLPAEGEVDDYLARFQLHGERGQALRDSLRLELEAVTKAYQQAGSESWNAAAAEIAKADRVYVLGFQASKGLAIDFASRLLWVRPNVLFVNSDSGTYGEVLMADPATSVVVMIDTATYAVRAVRLAEKLKAAGMPLVIVTDKYSLWGWAYTGWVFEAHTFVKTFWDSTAGIAVLLNLMLDTVAERLGPRARSNFQRMAETAKMFGEFVSKHAITRRE